MEKRIPHCKLSIIRALVKAGKVRATSSALASGAVLNMGFEDMISVIMALTPRDFYKSMTSYNDHRIWHDVYHAVTREGQVYLKLIVIDDVLIVSFKEL